MKGLKLTALALAVAVVCMLPGTLSAKGPKFSFNFNFDALMPPRVIEQPVYVPTPVYPAPTYYYVEEYVVQQPAYYYGYTTRRPSYAQTVRQYGYSQPTSSTTYYQSYGW